MHSTSTGYSMCGPAYPYMIEFATRYCMSVGGEVVHSSIERSMQMQYCTCSIFKKMREGQEGVVILHRLVGDECDLRENKVL